MRLARNVYENYILVNYIFSNTQQFDKAKNINIWRVVLIEVWYWNQGDDNLSVLWFGRSTMKDFIQVLISYLKKALTQYYHTRGIICLKGL